MEEKPLYEDGQLKITFLHSPEPGENDKIISTEDHELWIKEKDEDQRYALPRGCLNEFAQTKRDRLESKLRNMNPEIKSALEKNGLTIDSAHIAICQAYIENEERISRGIKEMNL